MYDAPRKNSTPPNKAGVWLEDRYLVVPTDYKFPAICLKTGATSDLKKVSRAFDSYELNGDALSVQTTKRKAGLEFYLHAKAVQREWLMKPLVILVFLAIVGVAVALMVAEKSPLLAFAVIGIGAGIFAWLYAKYAMSITASKVRASYVWLSGVPRDVREAIYELDEK